VAVVVIGGVVLIDDSVFLAVKHASKAMMKTSAEKLHSGGSIIATASTAGIRSGAGASMLTLTGFHICGIWVLMQLLL
jgi:NAD(P)-dependent dehydrogenase (short-subunit alcohol dehydrogenase family)